jgi:hypothetical protein
LAAISSNRVIDDDRAQAFDGRAFEPEASDFSVRIAQSRAGSLWSTNHACCTAEWCDRRCDNNIDVTLEKPVVSAPRNKPEGRPLRTVAVRLRRVARTMVAGANDYEGKLPCNRCC